MKRRTLTVGEAEILRMIQEEYGPQNTEKEVFFSETDEAVLFVKARDDTSPLMVVLTNLAAWRQDGTIANDDVLRSEWLRARRT
ncbi:MAG: hypothetical protein ABJC10_11475 [Acidobacteriota bacterium]